MVDVVYMEIFKILSPSAYYNTYGIYWLATNAKCVPFAFVPLHKHAHIRALAVHKHWKSIKIVYDLEFVFFFRHSGRRHSKISFSLWILLMHFVARNEWHVYERKEKQNCCTQT